MTIRALAKSFWNAIKPHLIRIGRWLLRVLARRGLRKLIGYMECKADKWEDSLPKLRAKWRRRWRKGRIDRWRRAAAWLERHYKQITKGAVRRIEKAANDAGIPMKSKYESESRERRRAA